MELSNRFSKLVDAKLRTTLVLKDGVIFNNRYEGDPKAGAVKVRKSGKATVQKYDPNTGAELTTGASEYILIDINNDVVINEKIDGFEAAAVTDNMFLDRLEEGTRAMQVALDEGGAECLATEGTVFGDTTAVTPETIYGIAVDVNKALSKAGVPAAGRYMVVSPDVYASILKAPEFIKASELGDAVVQTGAVGKIGSMNVYECCYLPENVEFIAGHPDYAARVREWKVDVHLQDLSASGKWIGASAVQGRSRFAHKVTAPEAILVKKSA